MVSAWPVPDEEVAGDRLGRAARVTGGDQGWAAERAWEDTGVGFGVDLGEEGCSGWQNDLGAIRHTGTSRSAQGTERLGDLPKVINMGSHLRVLHVPSFKR